MSDPAAWQSPPSGVAPVWTPPPKPGVIPLRPLTFGQLLGTPFQVLRRSASALFGPAVLIQAITLIVSLLIVGAATGLFVYRVDRATDADRQAIVAGGVASVILAGLIALALSVIGSALLQGLVVVSVANGALGHRPRTRQLWAATRGRRWALVGFIALLSAAVLVAVGAVGGVAAAFIVPAVSGGGTGLAAVGVLVALLGGLGLMVLFAWLWAKTSLSGSAIILERLGVRAAIARSWSLSGRAFWRVFGAQFLVIAICYVATELVSTPVSFAFQLALGVALPTGTPSDLSSDASPATIGIGLAALGAVLLVGLVMGALTGIIEAASSVLVYIDQRMRREGLDLMLQRYVEDVQTGRPLGDPFATPVHERGGP